MQKHIKSIIFSAIFLCVHLTIIGGLMSGFFRDYSYDDSFVYSLLLIFTGGVALYISYFAYFAFKRSRNIQMFIFSASFFVYGVSYLIFTLSGPDFNFLGVFKTVFALSQNYGLFFGSMLLGTLLLPLENYQRKVYVHRLEIFLSIIVSYSLAILAVVVYPEYAFDLHEISGVFLGSSYILLFLVFIFLFHQFRQLGSRFLINLCLGVVFLISAIIITFFDRVGSFLWWYGQLSIFISFAIVISAFIQAQWTKYGFEIVSGGMPISSRIGAKLLGSFLFVAALSIFLTGYFSFSTAQNSLRSQVESNLELTTQSKESDVIDFINKLKSATVALATSESMLDAIVDFENNGTSEKLLSLMESGQIEYYQIDILDNDGNIVMSTDSGLVGKSKAVDSYSQQRNALPVGEAYLTDVYMLYGSLPVLTSMANIYENSGIKHGSVAITIEAKILDQALKNYKGDARMGLETKSQIEVYLVGRENHIITTTSYYKDISLRQESLTKPVVMCKYGDSLVGEYEDYKKVTVVGASICLGNGWTLISEISTDEAYSSLEVIKVKILLASLLIIIVVFILVFALIRKITGPIQELSRVAKKISEGDLSLRAVINEGGEMGLLARSFNDMTQNIVSANKTLEEQYDQLKKTSNALVEAKDNLEIKVSERTKELEDAKRFLEQKVRERTRELQVLNENLEHEVLNRTKELNHKLVELERFNKLAVGRELRMIELKDELKELKRYLKSKKIITKA